MRGYKIYYGTSPGLHSTVVDVGIPSGLSYTLSALPSGASYYFAMTAYNEAGESEKTAEVVMPALAVSIAGSGTGSVNGSVGGIACASGSERDCRATFRPNTQVTLLPSPSWNSSFVGWSGACSGRGPCVVVMDSPKTVVANFSGSAIAQLGGPTPRLFPSIQAACDASAGNAVVKVMGVDALEDVIIDRLGTLSLTGGLDPQFQRTTGKTTVKSLKVRGGKLVVRDLVIR